MAKYKLKALSVQIAGKLFKKEQGVVFDTDGDFKAHSVAIESAAKAGFLEKVKTAEPKKSKK